MAIQVELWGTVAFDCEGIGLHQVVDQVEGSSEIDGRSRHNGRRGTVDLGPRVRHKAVGCPVKGFLRFYSVVPNIIMSHFRNREGELDDGEGIAVREGDGRREGSEFIRSVTTDGSIG